MRPGKATIIFCSSLLLLAGLLTNKFLIFLNELNPDTDVHRKNITLKYPVIGKSADNLIWMIQISDLHLSAFHDPTRISELKTFCGATLDIIRPSVVLATGDLTDAKTPDGEGSTQYEEEWISYKDVLYEANVPSKVLWLDIRGNHDNFDVLCLNSENNYFRKYSMQGSKHPRSYFYVYKMNNSEKVGFLGVDACLEVGTRRPFNFVGQLTENEMHLIEKYNNESRSLDVNYMFWFGHYPTSTIQYPDSEKLRHLIANDERAVGYFCGHLHQIGGLVPNMYTWQKEGYFEFELGDWRGNRIFRLMAIDHGQFSFIDIKHGVWPIVLVTHPKPVILVPPGGKLSVPHSNYIRMLIFDPTRVVSVQRRIDLEEWVRCDYVDGSLYVSEWDQDAYDEGLHDIEIEIIDDNGKQTIHHHQFSLDGTRVKTEFLPRLFLMPNLGKIFFYFFVITIVFCTVLLLGSRYMIKRIKGEAASSSSVTQCHWSMKPFKQTCILTYFNTFYYPLILYPIYLFFGPWAIVYLVSNNLGVIFSWGLITNGTFVPSWITYPFGWIQIVLHMILIFHLAACFNQRYFNVINRTETRRSHLFIVARSLYENKFYIFVLLIQIWDTYNFWLCYGHLTLIFCPLKTWWILMAIWLKCKIHTISKEKLVQVHRFWYSS